MLKISEKIKEKEKGRKKRKKNKTTTRMIANVFWCGKIYNIDFVPSKEGIAALGNELEKISKIPVAHQMILFQGIAIPLLKASFGVNKKSYHLIYLTHLQYLRNASVMTTL